MTLFAKSTGTFDEKSSQIGELTPPESQRNSTEDSDPSSIENSEDAHVEVEVGLSCSCVVSPHFTSPARMCFAKFMTISTPLLSWRSTRWH